MSQNTSVAAIPLGALLFASAPFAQTVGPTVAQVQLSPVLVHGAAIQAKDALRATSTTTGKGKQDLRDVPQSIPVVTEKLIDDRNLDTVKDALRQTAGISFLAAEGGEEDIRLRGFSLAATGDIFLDGMRDPAFYDRDTFNLDRMDVMRGSASMLFGRGSTGCAVNQVSKAPRAITEHEVTTTLGTHNYGRITGDFNFATGKESALRINAMATKADNNGAGSSIHKQGLAAAYLASDRNKGGAKIAAISHVHRFSPTSELRTIVRKGAFERDLRPSTIRFASPTSLANFGPTTLFTRGAPLKVQDMDTLHAQSDFQSKFRALGLEHSLLAGVDAAQEEKTVYLARSAAQGGVNLVKPTTSAQNPDDGAWIDESQRVLRLGNEFTAKCWGAYVQDLVQVAAHWKVLGGIRYDRLDGRYTQNNIPTTAPAPQTTVAYRQQVSEWSKRVGVLYQPSELQSLDFSYGTSFNTSGDTYSYNAQSANTPPEQSENIEFGARLDSPNRAWTTRIAVFRSTKKNERNTDPDTAATRLLLPGKRHSAGIEVDVAGRITPAWEVYACNGAWAEA